ncbi:MAG TPA: hypothetical protein QGF95_23875 [Candidatus Latescibacteria bacterium]|nr:hypothetical protein [Gemmatimonadaceae bacterium]MDP6018170.1 hypothetical protein [Candidatus Latescibacterota bacterium]HJP33602.1 hypothetical protein [Candidatus Latescibacterota bacterium]|tara:strand:- start:455 stop:1177 length:723 start_codon:yes stop_codon:yes gene_type:complete
MTDVADTIRYRYDFLLPGGTERTFDLHLDRSSLALAPVDPAAPLPAWTELGCSQCDNCPLQQQAHPHCPIAANISDFVGFFSDAASYEEIDLRISTDERSYVKRTHMSEAVSSLLGIYMVTSGCPVMEKLRPMVRFHLPLATAEETTFRALAMYLVAQYFVSRSGGTPDWELANLPHIYQQVQIVNRGFTERLRQSVEQDASLNAVVRLDAFVGIILLSLNADMLDDIQRLFASYLPEGG